MTSTPSRTRLRYATFGVALCVLAAVGAATMWSFERTARSFDWVEHTYRVIAMLQEYHASVREAESAARGYRLTGNPQLRDAFFRVRPEIERQLAELGSLVADNPSQVVRLRGLDQLTARRLELSEILITTAAEDKLPPALMDTGTRTMAAIDAQLRPMLATEQLLLRARNARSAWETRLLIGFVLAGTVFSLLLLGLLMKNLQVEARQSRLLERQARDAASGLEHSVAQLRRVSEQRGSLARYASLLQSCHDIEEALRVTGHVVDQLLPGSGGRCYLLRASQDLAETAIAFGAPAAPSSDLLHPAECWALRRGQPYAVEDLVHGIACAHVATTAVPDDGWSLCVPLLAQGTALGLLHVTGTGIAGLATAQELIESVAEQLGLALVNLQLRDRLRMQSLRDPLTGLFNRRYLDESLQREVVRCQRRSLPMAVLMLDVDHFKAFNDTHGHAAGDALLAAIGHALQSVTRSEDLVCRYGGEEFTVVLVETSPDEALVRANEIRSAIGTTTVQHLKRTLGPCTASIGMAMLPRDGITPTELLEKADAALYRSKAAGRDRVTVATHA
jgi:diguanylate cyclase (GGDEF)-like protein